MLQEQGGSLSRDGWTACRPKS